MILRNKKLLELERFCGKDPVRHAFCLWDLKKEMENTEFYIDWRGEIKGYMLIYTGGDFPSVIIQGSRKSAEIFAEMMPIHRGVIHFPSEYWDIFKIGDTRYRIDIMVAEPRFYFIDKDVKVITSKEKLKKLFINPEYLVEKAITYGIEVDGYAVSVASALVHLPEVWVLGAVTTHKNYRNRGFATRVVGHFMSMAYGHTERVVLWVRSDNETAIKIYRKYGFKKIGEEGWINVDVDIVP